jgi:hypothetical protein
MPRRNPVAPNKRVRERIKRHVALAHLRIPDRDTVDEITGETWEGIPGIKMAENAVDSDVLASGSTNPERAVDTGHIKDNAVTAAKITSVNAGAVGGTGKVGWANVDSPANLVTGSYNGNPGKLGYNDLGGTPDLSKFVKDDQLATRTTSGQVKNIIKNMVKKSALQ